MIMIRSSSKRIYHNVYSHKAKSWGGWMSFRDEFFVYWMNGQEEREKKRNLISRHHIT